MYRVSVNYHLLCLYSSLDSLVVYMFVNLRFVNEFGNLEIVATLDFSRVLQLKTCLLCLMFSDIYHIFSLLCVSCYCTNNLYYCGCKESRNGSILGYFRLYGRTFGYLRAYGSTFGYVSLHMYIYIC